MRRQEFIGSLIGTAVAWPIAASAQQPASKLYRIGMLETLPSALDVANLSAFRKGLQERGYVEGKDYVIEYRSANGIPERFPQLAAELVLLKVDLIVTRGTSATQAVKAATSTIPVVIASSGDPLGAGLIDSLSHPGGNVTGFSGYYSELSGKRVELAKEIVPGVLRVAPLSNMGNPLTSPQWEETKTVAGTLGVEADFLDVHRKTDIGAAFETALARCVDVLLVGIDTATQANRQLIVDLAARNGLPTVYASREFVDAGGLMAYGVSYPPLYFRAAILVDKIFKGAKAGDLQVEQPTKLELVINLNTAKALGVTIPPSIMVRADEILWED
jgi:putative ABC transport system substrate-binding protein